MKTYYYTKNDLIKNNLEKIDQLRIKFALKSLNPKNLYYLQWVTLNNRINLLIDFNEIKNTNSFKELLKNLFIYIYYNFFGLTNILKTNNLLDLYFKYFNGRLLISENEIDKALKYIQISQEHPIIQACISKIIFFDLNSFSKFNNLFSDIIFNLFLYKYGYDFKKIAVFENIYIPNSFKKIFSQSLKKENLTPWIEFFTSELVNLLEKTYQEIDQKKETVNYSFLNERQKQILFLFENPEIKITNKLIMKKFKISPVTASRDLAKLVKYNLIIMVGKGRSTYYLKV